MPALAIGFDDLQKRVEAQRSQASAHQAKLDELKKRIAALSNAHSTTNAPRLQRALAVQTQLQQRLVRLVQHLHLLIPSVRSSSIRPEEESLRSTLESLEEEIRKPGGVGRLKGKLSELWAVIGAIEAARERERKSGENTVEWAVVDSDGLQRLAQVCRCELLHEIHANEECIIPDSCRRAKRYCPSHQNCTWTSKRSGHYPGKTLSGTRSRRILKSSSKSDAVRGIAAGGTLIT